jgi:hypothetical protein
MAENIVDREEAEGIVKEAIDNYVDIETLQQIIDLIYGDEFIVVEEIDRSEDDEFSDYDDY